MKTVFFALLISLSASAFLRPKPFYAGVNSSEAILRFNYFVDSEANERPSPVRARQLIDHQLTFIFGALSYLQTPASPYGHQTVNIQNIEKTAEGFRISYSFVGGIVIFDRVGSELLLPLPRDPEKIYSQSLIANGNKLENPCGDDAHPGSENYWYFWAPQISGCPLVEGQHFDWVKGKIQWLPNTHKSLPDYERLVNEKNEIRMDVFVGMDNSSNSGNVFDSKDFNANGYNQIRDYLLREGYQSTVWTDQQVRDHFVKAFYQPVTVEDLKKDSPRGALHVRMFFGSTASWKADLFRRFYKESLEQASIVVYVGHSGLGKYLNIDDVENQLGEKINFNQEKYQIYFFNACSTYPYYNSSYFDRKGGSQGLDIITNGLATFLNDMGPSTIRLLEMVNRWAITGDKTTYDEFLMKADSSNLLGVNGDEDNPKAE